MNESEDVSTLKRRSTKKRKSFANLQPENETEDVSKMRRSGTKKRISFANLKSENETEDESKLNKSGTKKLTSFFNLQPVNEENKSNDSHRDSCRNDDTLRNMVDKQQNPEIISTIDIENNTVSRNQ